MYDLSFLKWYLCNYLFKFNSLVFNMMFIKKIMMDNIYNVRWCFIFLKLIMLSNFLNYYYGLLYFRRDF